MQNWQIFVIFSEPFPSTWEILWVSFLTFLHIARAQPDSSTESSPKHDKTLGEIQIHSFLARIFGINKSTSFSHKTHA